MKRMRPRRSDAIAPSPQLGTSTGKASAGSVCFVSVFRCRKGW